MHLSENEGIDGQTFLVTGGAGFVGAALCLELVRRGARNVRAFDLREVSPWTPHLLNGGVQCIRGDVCQKEDLKKALRGTNCVFHLAAFGMSGKETLQVGRVDEVNINGTCNVIDTCIELGVRRLVYVSTYNVVFGGEEILNGNEALPYFPIDDHVDPYGRSKSIAEQLVLKTNGHYSKKIGGLPLYTCAIRPAAIYGPGEERHLPRIISMAKMGLLRFRIGKASVKTDWVYVDNLVLALILASMGTLDNIPGKEGRPIAAGQSYFISDGSPINTFEFIQPLLRSLEYDIPKTTLSVPNALFVARFFWIMYSMLYPWLNHSWLIHPLILPAEVNKVGVTHYFSFLKAKQELGYIPMVSQRDGMAATVSYWKERKRRTIDGPALYIWLFVVVGMLLLFYAAYLPAVWQLKWVNALHLFFFRSVQNVQVVFLLSTAAHIGEGLYAWYLAKRVDPANSRGWFLQTLVLGIFSLRYLLKRSKRAE